MTSTVGREGTRRSVAAPMLGAPFGGWCTRQHATLWKSRIGFESLPPSPHSIRALREHVFVSGSRFTEGEAREAIAAADCWAEALRLLGMRVAGGNHKTIQRAAARWNISTEHFDPRAVRARASRRGRPPLEEILVQGSTYKRDRLKERL